MYGPSMYIQLAWELFKNNRKPAATLESFHYPNPKKSSYLLKLTMLPGSVKTFTRTCIIYIKAYMFQLKPMTVYS